MRAQLKSHGGARIGYAEVVAFTALGICACAALMARLGMLEQGEFDHPALAATVPCVGACSGEWRGVLAALITSSPRQRKAGRGERWIHAWRLTG